MEPVVRVKNLRKIYKIGKERVVALNNINFEISQGEIVAIVGPSGSGKSTLLNQLAGLEKPTKGDVFIGKRNLSKMKENELAEFRQKHLGFIFQSYNLLSSLSAEENVALPLVFKGVEKQERLREARKQLEQIGLLDRAKHKPTEMSGGQQQRVGIARAFVGKPRVIFADEPTGNLDTKTTKLVMENMLSHARDNKTTFIMVTHDPRLAEMANRVISILDGEIISNQQQEASTELDELPEIAMLPKQTDEKQDKEEK